VGQGAITLRQDAGVDFAIEDPEGQVKALLDLLDGTRTIDEITSALAGRWPKLTSRDVGQGVGMLDEAGLLEDAAAETSLSHEQQERYFSNLSFFGTYSSLARCRYSFQEKLCRSHVALLGVGGLGSTLLYNLAGLGVGHITVLDFDTVELRNFARQFLYAEAEIGESKVERAAARARSFNSDLKVSVVERRIERPGDVSRLLENVDLVLAAVDQPADVRDWVNDACVPAGIPFITGSFHRGRGMYWSVDPGRSGCQACWRVGRLRDAPPAFEHRKQVNRGIGPVASLLGSLVALEALRYLTRFSEPISSGKLWLVDFGSGRIELAQEWPKLPDCPICGFETAEPEVVGN
jgi:molybdopterin-synthase adenylyltransferase